jgi:hypothetical protein
MNRFPDHTVAGLTNAVVAYRDAAAEARRLAALPTMHDEVHPFAAPIMQATLEEFARIMEKKATNLEAKIAETALVEGSA